MSVKKEASGRRSVQVEVEVPGTPEEVWQAIATGPGISSWFVPTEVEEREGGAVVSHFGPRHGSPATVTAWDPPRRFAAERAGLGPGRAAGRHRVDRRGALRRHLRRARGAQPVREQRRLGRSARELRVRLAGLLLVLRLYLTHFRGQRCAPLRLLAITSRTEREAWDELSGALGLRGATPGERRAASGSGAPPLAGVVEKAGVFEGGSNPHEVILRLDEPAPGVAIAGAYTWGGHVHASVSFYLFGEQGAAAMARDEPLWRAWMSERFPRPQARSPAGERPRSPDGRGR